MIIAFLERYNFATRQDINNLLLDKLSDALNEQQKLNKIRNLIYSMSKKEKTIKNLGSDRNSKWVLT